MTRTRAAAAVLACAVAIMLATTTSATAAAAEHRSGDTDQRGKVTKRAGKPLPKPVVDNCAELKKNWSKLRATGKRYAACVSPLEETSEKYQKALRASAKQQDDVYPAPLWCWEHYGLGWRGNRLQSCETSGGVLTIRDVRTGVITGEMIFEFAAYSFTTNQTTTWQTQLEITALTQWGSAINPLVEGSAYCTAYCDSIDGSFPSQTLLSDRANSAKGAFYTSDEVAQGSTSSSTTIMEWFFWSPNWVGPTNFMSSQAQAVRCDDALPETEPAGCVFSDNPAILEYSEQELPELVDHIRDAQADGLPGAPGGDPLHRLTDPILRDKNRNTACPSSLPRPPGMECDEYPFASTLEGAFTGGGLYSTRMITASQNQAGGVQLGLIYRNQRVLDRDAFYVRLTA